MYHEQIVREINDLGMLIDLGHINEKGFYDTLEISSSPVIVSHANALALYNHPRNISDHQLRALRDNDGVIGLSCCPDFVDTNNATMKNCLTTLFMLPMLQV